MAVSLLVTVLGAMAAAEVHAQSGSRQALEARFVARASTAAGFAQADVNYTLERERARRRRSLIWDQGSGMGCRRDFILAGRCSLRRGVTKIRKLLGGAAVEIGTRMHLCAVTECDDGVGMTYATIKRILFGLVLGAGVAAGIILPLEAGSAHAAPAHTVAAPHPQASVYLYNPQTNTAAYTVNQK